jgi:hypothetical protein
MVRAGRPTVPLPTFSACIWCACGAKYERAEAQLPIKDIGIYECVHCSAVLERWHGRVVPTFRLIERPREEGSNAA